MKGEVTLPTCNDISQNRQGNWKEEWNELHERVRRGKSNPPVCKRNKGTSDCKERQTRGRILTCFSSGHCMMHRSVFISVPNAQETTSYITVFQGYYLIKTRCQLVMNRLRNCTETINKKMNSSDLFPGETLGQANYRIRVWFHFVTGLITVEGARS